MLCHLLGLIEAETEGPLGRHPSSPGSEIRYQSAISAAWRSACCTHRGPHAGRSQKTIWDTISYLSPRSCLAQRQHLHGGIIWEACCMSGDSKEGTRCTERRREAAERRVMVNPGSGNGWWFDGDWKGPGLSESVEPYRVSIQSLSLALFITPREEAGKFK